MTFAGVKDIGVASVGVPTVFRFSVGQDIYFATTPARDGIRRYVVALDYSTGEMIIGSGIVRRSFWQRLRAAWRVLRGGLP